MAQAMAQEYEREGDKQLNTWEGGPFTHGTDHDLCQLADTSDLRKSFCGNGFL